MRQNESLHYLDNAATTLVAPQVADAIYKTMTEHWGNPSSLYGPAGQPPPAGPGEGGGGRHPGGRGGRGVFYRLRL